MIIHLNKNISKDKAEELAHKYQAALFQNGSFVLVTSSKVKAASDELKELAEGIFVTDTDIQLAAHHSGNGRRVSIKVRDQGIGMNEQERAQAFEKFYRADKSGTIPGTGLGLALVREIMQLHGGTVHLESQPARGTTAVIELNIL